MTYLTSTAHYVSQVVTVMTAWQEAVQASTSHMDTMETMDTAMYLAHCEDVRMGTKEYIAAVVKAREERDMAHTVEHQVQKEGHQGQ